jgi:phage terminase large subunit-like protein
MIDLLPLTYRLNESDLDRIRESGDEELCSLVKLATEHPYYSFEPREDDPPNYDEQESFVNSKALVTFTVGGNGSGKTYCAAQKAARFVLEEQPPPKRDTPFWIIAGTYPQVGQSAWAQKLREMIPPAAIDKITWRDVTLGYPNSIRLHPWPGRPDANWLLQFKSYEQGREEMQAAAIGGAWFTEQFPWDVFQEVFRGCREYMFPGSVFADFTPIDPEKSVPVEEAYEKWEEGNPLYEQWNFCRMNTEAAKDAGHVDSKWYDTFFSMVSDEMMDTRKIGAFASYEGTIYQSFNPAVHLIRDGEFDRSRVGCIIAPPNCHHRRSIDFGASAEHPFVCLWAFRNGLGQYYVYDEYWCDAQNMTALDHIETITDRHRWADDAHHGATYGDPSRPDLINLFSARGIPVIPARNAVYEGIECVRTALKINQSIGLEGEPSLFIDPVKCPKLARQMRTYRWERSSKNLRAVNPKAARPVPLKKDDDCVDALRYLLYSDARGMSKLTSQRALPDAKRHGVHLEKRA